MVSVYPKDVAAACLADPFYSVYSFSRSAGHACSNAASIFDVFLTLCRTKINNILKMRNRNPNKKVTPPKPESDSDESADVNELPESVAADSVVEEVTSRSRSALFSNKTSDVRESKEFKDNGWDCIKIAEKNRRRAVAVERSRKFEEGRKKKADEAAAKKNTKNSTSINQTTSSSWKNTRNSTSINPTSKPLNVERRSRSPVKKVQQYPPKAVVTRQMVTRNHRRVEETLAHRWARLGGPQPRPVQVRSYTQTPEDPALVRDRLTGKKSVGIKIQTRLDNGILESNMGAGEYLREEFRAHLRVPRLESELASNKVELKAMGSCLKDLKEDLAQGAVENVKKGLILKKLNADKTVVEKKYEKSKNRKRELKKVAKDLAKVAGNERDAAAKKINDLERETRALRCKMELMRLDFDEFKGDKDYDTDDCLSAVESAAADMTDDGETEEDVDTDSELSEDNEEWDLFLERKPKDAAD